MLRSFDSESANNEYAVDLNKDLAGNQQLLKEYSQGINRLKKTISNYGLDPLTLCAMGSLTRHDKAIRFDPENPETLLSDADFVCLVKKPLLPRSVISAQLLLTGQAVLSKQADEGNSLPPFSEHIPYFQVEFLTESQCLKILTAQTEKLREYVAEYLRNPPQNQEEYDDVLDVLRGFKSALIVYRHLNDGVLLEGVIPPKIREICDDISSLLTSIYSHLEKF